MPSYPTSASIRSPFAGNTSYFRGCARELASLINPHIEKFLRFNLPGEPTVLKLRRGKCFPHPTSASIRSPLAGNTPYFRGCARELASPKNPQTEKVQVSFLGRVSPKMGEFPPQNNQVTPSRKYHGFFPLRGNTKGGLTIKPFNPFPHDFVYC